MLNKTLFVLVLPLLLLACDTGQDAAASAGGMPPAAVTAAYGRVGTLEESLIVVGSLVANKHALLSAETSGRLTAFHTGDGAEVKAGDKIFSIESASLNAELKRAQANVKLYEQEAKRAKSLFKQRVSSQTEVDRALAQLETALAERDYAKAQLDEATLLAPFAGRLGIAKANVGDFMQKGTELIELVQLDPILVDFNIPETAIQLVKIGSSLHISIPATDSQHTAQISAIEPSINVASRSVKVRAHLENDDKTLRPGLFARVQLPTKSIERVVWVAEGAVFFQGDRKLVMVNDNNSAKRLDVQIGSYQNGEVAITHGLSGDEQIIIAGHHKAPVDGMPLLITNAADFEPKTSTPTVTEDNK